MGQARVVQVFIADDHPVVAESIHVALQRDPGIVVNGWAGSVPEIFSALRRSPAEVLITDYAMRGSDVADGISMLSQLAKQFPQTRMVVFTGIENPSVLAAVWGAGVHGLVSKTDPLEQLLLAIKCAIEDKRYCSTRVDQILREIDVARGKATTQLLTNREVEVLRFFLGGLGTTEIAEHLGRSVKTISNQKWAAMRKLGCESDQALFELHAMGALKLGTQM